MKRIITLLAIILSTATSHAQDIYPQKMGEALGQFGASKTVSDYISAAASFDRIASAESEKWLPIYYHAQIYILISFIDSEADGAKKDSYLDLAEVSIKKMIEIAPQESEVYALEGLYHTARLVINPMLRAQKHSALSAASTQKSLALDADNPRAKQIELSNKVGAAQFFGKDISAYCKEANQLLADWDSYPSKGAFYPTWGKEQVQGIVNNCKPAESNDNATSTEESGFTITITIHKLKSDNGLILLSLMDEFEKPVQQTIGHITNNESTIVLSNIEAGTYAIRYFHDENNNQKLDKDKRGIPQEKYGASNNARGFMKAPKYKKMLFTVSENMSMSLKAK